MLNNDLYQAAMIDCEGNEVPITQAMIKQACAHLEESHGQDLRLYHQLKAQPESLKPADREDRPR